MSVFGINLKFLREFRMVNRADFCLALNIDVGTIEALEDGTLEPTLDQLKKISDFFDVKIDWFVKTSFRYKREPVKKSLTVTQDPMADLVKMDVEGKYMFIEEYLSFRNEEKEKTNSHIININLKRKK